MLVAKNGDSSLVRRSKPSHSFAASIHLLLNGKVNLNLTHSLCASCVALLKPQFGNVSLQNYGFILGGGVSLSVISSKDTFRNRQNFRHVSEVDEPSLNLSRGPLFSGVLDCSEVSNFGGAFPGSKLAAPPPSFTNFGGVLCLSNFSFSQGANIALVPRSPLHVQRSLRREILRLNTREDCAAMELPT